MVTFEIFSVIKDQHVSDRICSAEFRITFLAPAKKLSLSLQSSLHFVPIVFKKFSFKELQNHVQLFLILFPRLSHDLSGANFF